MAAILPVAAGLPATIVAEACYLLGSRCGARVEAAFLETLAAGTPFEVSAPTADDYVRMADLVRRYENLPLGSSAAAVIALAERLRTTEIATLDHRHFRVVRPQHVPVFTLVPQ